ncbi:hypothetical protein CWI37_1203p0010 [Hamiltosporidium tvaerminnensis]|uniref:Uncharacterized protein n=1 Tax=Hamiltosporidium tvaerminnensis TaxID=1176355 RepID=A0A4Q9KY03_9MICR|nr:hypothetical protein CWI37_1203p0010 [Hamiltosporidium tvaerminnensis]
MIFEHKNVGRIRIRDSNISRFKKIEKNRRNNKGNLNVCERVSKILLQHKKKVKSGSKCTSKVSSCSFSVNRAEITTKKNLAFKHDKTGSVGNIDDISSNEDELERIYKSDDDDKKHEYFLSKISEILEKKIIFELDSRMNCLEKFSTDKTFKNLNLKIIFFWLQTLSKELFKIDNDESLMSFKEIIVAQAAEEKVYGFIVHLKANIALFVRFNFEYLSDCETNLSQINIIVGEYLIELFLNDFQDKVFHFFPQFQTALNFIFNSENSYNHLNLYSALPTFLLIIIAEDTYRKLQIDSRDTKDILYSNFYFERLLILNYLIREIFCSLNNISDKVKPETFKMIAEFMDNINFFDENKNKLSPNPISEEYKLFTYYNFYYSILLFLYIGDSLVKNNNFETSLFDIIGYLNLVFNEYKNKTTLNFPLILNDIEEKSKNLIKLKAFEYISSQTAKSELINVKLKILTESLDKHDITSVFDKIEQYNRYVWMDDVKLSFENIGEKNRKQFRKAIKQIEI